MPLLWICFFETIAVSWFYGTERFVDNIKSMIGNQPYVFTFCYYCWKYFAPAVMGVSNKSLKSLLYNT